MVVYAMDRNRATPLTTFCPMDVLRNTLGVGPCQYILQTEGLATDANPTPDNVMTWVEKQFSRKKEKKAAEEIREQLDQMVEHVGHAQARIDEYGRFAGEVRQLCEAAGPQPATRRPPRLDRIAAGLQQTVAATETEKPAPADRAAQLAGRNRRPDRQGRCGGRVPAAGGIGFAPSAPPRMPRCPTAAWPFAGSGSRPP